MLLLFSCLRRSDGFPTRPDNISKKYKNVFSIHFALKSETEWEEQYNDGKDENVLANAKWMIEKQFRNKKDKKTWKLIGIDI